MYSINKIDIISMAKVVGAISAVATIIPLIFMAFITMLFSGLFTTPNNAVTMILTSAIVLPVLGFIGGFIYGAVMAFIYNIIAKYGIKFKMELQKDDSISESQTKPQG